MTRPTKYNKNKRFTTPTNVVDIRYDTGEFHATLIAARNIVKAQTKPIITTLTPPKREWFKL